MLEYLLWGPVAGAVAHLVSWLKYHPYRDSPRVVLLILSAIALVYISIAFVERRWEDGLRVIVFYISWTATCIVHWRFREKKRLEAASADSVSIRDWLDQQNDLRR